MRSKSWDCLDDEGHTPAQHSHTLRGPAWTAQLLTQAHSVAQSCQRTRTTSPSHSHSTPPRFINSTLSTPSHVHNGQEQALEDSLQPVRACSRPFLSLRELTTTLSRLDRHFTPLVLPSPRSTAPKLARADSKKNQATDIKTRRYKRDIDQIHEDMKDGGKKKFLEDLTKKDIEDLPGASSLARSLFELGERSR